MSRTRKKSKSPGYEYWSKRPISSEKGAIPGRYTKKRTHKKERATTKYEIVAKPDTWKEVVEKVIKSRR